MSVNDDDDWLLVKVGTLSTISTVAKKRVGGDAKNAKRASPKNVNSNVMIKAPQVKNQSSILSMIEEERGGSQIIKIPFNIQ